MDRGHEIQEVHRIDIQGLAQIGGGIDLLQIDLGGDVSELLLEHRANVGFSHSLSGSCSSLPISARNSAPA